MADVKTPVLISLFGVSERRIYQLIDEGVVIAGSGKGNYKLYESVKNYIALAKQENKGGVDVADQKLRLTTAQADLAELKVAEARGELISTSNAITAWGEAIMMMKTKMLAIPSKAAQAVRVSLNDSEAKHIMEKYIKSALSDLANVNIQATIDYDEDGN